MLDDVWFSHSEQLLQRLLEDDAAPEFRVYVGYAGWAPGQLDKEILFGSWHIIPATEEIVFTEDPDEIWQQLAPPQHYRASAGLQDRGPFIHASNPN